MNDRTMARELTVALWVVAAGTVAAALVLAAVDRLLIASAVCFIGGLPAALLVWGIERRTPPRSDAEKRAGGLRQGLTTAAGGAVSATVGGILLIVAPDAVGRVPDVLLSAGATLLIGGVTAQRYSLPRAEPAVEVPGKADQTADAPAHHGGASLLVRKNRHRVALWAAAMSALAGGALLADLAPRSLVGASVLFLGGLPLAALAATSRRAQDQKSGI